MKHRYASDCHSHSDCSFDGSSPMSAMCEEAIRKGLYYYTVSDHCECNKYPYVPSRESGYFEVVRKAWKQMKDCREAYPGLRFLRGIELGQPLEAPEAARDALSGRDYDFVLGSLHSVKGEKDFYHLGKEGLSEQRARDLITQYFEEAKEMLMTGDFDSLAHFTYPLRYLPAQERCPFLVRQEEADEVLETAVRREKAMELNTSRLLKTDGPYLPELELFTRYRELGGKLVTLGADAHCTADLAQGIDEGMELLKAAGFREFAVYVNRKPVMLPLE